MAEAPQSQSKRLALPASFYNPYTLAGAVIAAVSLGLIAFLVVMELLAEEHKPYMGIIAFVILPVFLLMGLALVVFGAVRRHRRMRRGVAKTRQLPRINLNDPRHLRATLIFSVGGILLLMMSAFGSYKAYEYTDSDQFCGETCHGVMAPEYTSYQASPHARVHCAKCHIGSGAEWFVRAKLSGTYQVYATIFNKYPRPIETPIKNLRPSRDTCEQCHWPAHFYSENLTTHDYYGYDEENSHWSLHLLMKIGGGGEAGPNSGIHWHMNLANEVSYVATDEKRLEIPWVRSRRADGTEVVYRSTEVDISDEQLAEHEMRSMDCVDCHNRPTHHYDAPGRIANELLAFGLVDKTLPSVKSLLVDVFGVEYETGEEAQQGIAEGVRSFYADEYPEITSTRGADIEEAIAQAQKAFGQNYFPEMRVSWKDFPDHIGHLYTPGCFRCHDGLHEAEDGTVLSRDCNVCHTIVAQEYTPEDRVVSLAGEEYRHPEDIDEAWKEMNCSECHGP